MNKRFWLTSIQGLPYMKTTYPEIEFGLQLY